MYPRHHAATVEILATASEVFAFADDHYLLYSHMNRRSWAMAGTAMTLECDKFEGRSVGSKLKLSGSILWLRLEVEKVVVERTPPAHWFGRQFGGWYARWCTVRMAHDAARHFNSAHSGTVDERAA